MADTQDLTSSPDDDASDANDAPSADWYAEQWSVLTEILDVSDPKAVVSRVRSLQENADALDENVESPVGPEEIGTAFREMNEQLDVLRRRNEELVERLESGAVGEAGTGEELHPKTEELLDELGAASLTEAQDRVRSLNQQVENLYQEKETLAEAGLMSSQEALNEINRLQRECDRLRSEHDRAPEALDEPASSEEAQELVDLARKTVDELRALATEANVEMPSVDASSSDLAALLRTARQQAAALHEVPLAPEQDERIADVLGIETVDKARELDRAVRQLGERLEGLTREKEILADTLGVANAGDVLDLVQSMEDQLSDFYASRDESYADRSNGRMHEEDTSVDAAEILGISSVDEARELDQAVRQLSERLEALTREKEILASTLGVADADDILDLVQSMEDQLSDFYAEQDGPKREENVPAEIEEILGVSCADEARELKAYVHNMADRLDRLSAEHEKLEKAGLDAEKALEIIDSMEEQLSALYSAADPSENDGPGSATSSSERTATENGVSKQSIARILGITTPEEARELSQMVREMSTQLERLKQEHAKLAEFDLSAEDALEMIDNMEDQLTTLYQSQDAGPPLTERLEPVEEVLGLPVPDDADAPLSALARQLEVLLEEEKRGLPGADEVETLSDLLRTLPSRSQAREHERGARADRPEAPLAPAAKEKLSEVGVSSVEDAVAMIQSMESQLEQLYEEQEALRDLPDPSGQQDTFQQLETLYKEQEKMRRALGVSNADDVIDMVEDLTAQLDALYARQESKGASSGAQDASADEGAPPADVQVTINSMRQQLETLYEEKEVLLRQGMESAEAAVTRIENLQERVQTLERKHEACREQMQRLHAELGTADVADVIQTVEELRAGSSRSAERLSKAVETDGPDDDPFVDSGPALLPADTLAQLDAMDASELDALSVGVLRLDNDGTILDLNDAAQAFPGLDEEAPRDRITGTRLFELVPSTSNTLFRGRFENGVERGEMDARFPYTFVTPGDQPTVLFIHLYRAADHQANWLLFQPA